MRTRRKAWAGWLSLGALLALATSCSVNAPRPTTQPPPPTPASATAAQTPASDGCRVDAKGVPTSCLGLFGVSLRPSTNDVLLSAEQKAGRRFDLVYRYHDMGAQLPDADELAAVQGGRLLHIAIASRLFNGGDIRYADIIAGRYDDVLRQQGAGVASLPGPVFLTFEQEGNQADKAGARGTAEEYVQAWRHVHDAYVAAGAHNALWVWVMMGDPAYAAKAGTLWPGNDIVDWISWNVYNQSGCRSGTVKPSAFSSFADGVAGFYDWVHGDGARLGIDATKPMMISESGSVPYADDIARTAQWYSDMPATLRRYPQVKAVTLWSGLDTTEAKRCDYRWQNNDTVTQAVARAGAELHAPR